MQSCKNTQDTNVYDVAVIGVGSMGSAACYHLAKRGVKVLGIEQFEIPHTKGSYGDTRIIRLAYSEHPSYIPLLKRAYENWRTLEKESQTELLIITGGIDVSPPDDYCFLGSVKSCTEYNIEHEILTGDELNERFPGFKVPSSFRAVYQKDGGILLAERCVIQHVRMAQQMNAQIHTREKFIEYTILDNGNIKILTDRGKYETKHLILTIGAWSNKFIHIDNIKVKGEPFNIGVPERQVLGWFKPQNSELYQSSVFPIFCMTAYDVHGDTNNLVGLYGFPILNSDQVDYVGFKLGVYGHFKEVIDPDHRNTKPNERDEKYIKTFVEEYFPDATGETIALKECMFTKSYDGHFIIDKLPGHDNIIIAGGFSGHGFKFCSIIGEVLADLALTGKSYLDIELFKLDRFK